MFNFLDLDDRVTAATVAATGTIIGALIQLRVAWRREVQERARGVPVTKKSRRGPVAAVVLLAVAAGVGGFAFSQSLVMKSEHETAALRGELRTQLEQINATATRLELATLSDRQATHAEEARRGPEEITVTATVGPCHARAVAGAEAAPACSEQEAQQVTLCASVPASAAAMDIVLYARPEDSTQPWAESRVAPGRDVFGRARFAEKPVERAESDRTKQVCTGFSAWDTEHGYSARLVVKYGGPAAAPAPATTEVTNTAAAPISASAH
jgi:hypothetical protein